MNNITSNAAALLRTLITYSICVPLALIIGYLLTDIPNLQYTTLGTFGVMALIIVSPVLLRWHHPLLVFSLQLSMSLFFIKGSPTPGLLMTALSLGISVLDRTLNPNRHFIRVPQISWPLVFFGSVVFFTAQMTGGIGLHTLGSDVYGGKKYIFLFLGILLYFALSARRVPPARAKFYVTLYFLSGMLSLISDLYPLAPHWMAPLFWFFPPSAFTFSGFGLGETRLGGFSTAGIALFCLLLARHGIRGILLSDRFWRQAMFLLSVSLVFLGGFRGQFFVIGMIFLILFFLEGLHRTKLLPVLIFLGTLGITILIPTASKLPFTFQRTLAFLPLHLDADARLSAQDTLDWRLQMWNALLPQIPQYLLLGKGLAISPEDYNSLMGNSSALGQAGARIDASQDPLALSYDYHNGPLSVLIPFGIWGALAFVWFMAVAVRALYANFRYGDPELRTINCFLFANFLALLADFLFVGGGIASDLMKFTGLVGLSVALNGGICQPATQWSPETEEIPRPIRPRWQPAFQK